MIAHRRLVSRMLGLVVLATTASAVAAPAHGATLSQTYSCEYPLITSQEHRLEVTADVPSVWSSGQPSPAFEITAVTTTNLDTRRGYALMGARSVEGTASLTMKATGFGLNLNVPASLDIAPVTLDDTERPVELVATGQTEPTPVPEIASGESVVSVESLRLNLRARRADGTTIVLPPVGAIDSDGDPETFDVVCALAPADQDRKLADIDVQGTAPDDLEPPTAPGTPVATDVTPTTATIGWAASTDNVGVQSYVVTTVEPDPATRTVSGTATSVDLTGLRPDTEYRIRVTARDRYQSSPPSGDLVFRTPRIPETDTDREYSCKIPLIGNQPMSLTVDADAPGTWIAGEPFPAIGVRAEATLDAEVAEALKLIGSVDVGGSAALSATFRAPGLGSLPVSIPLTVAEADYTGPAGKFVLLLEGSTPALTFPQPGTGTLDVGRIDFNLRAVGSEGAPIVLPPVVPVDSDGDPDTFDVPCDPPSQAAPPVFTVDIAVDGPGDVVPPTAPGTPFIGSPGDVTPTSATISWAPSTDTVGVTGYEVLYGDQVLRVGNVTTATLTPVPVGQEIRVRAFDAAGAVSAPSGALIIPKPVDPTVNYPFTLKGSSQLKALTEGTVPLSGSIAPTLNIATGEFTGDLILNQSRARLKVLGLLPVTADIAFAQTDKTRGTLRNGVLSTQSRFKIRLPQLYLFGVLPIVSPGTCETKSSSVAMMRSGAGFNPLQGGRLAGTYAISDLTGCGMLTSFISPLTKGTGNTIDLTLTPASVPVPPQVELRIDVTDRPGAAPRTILVTCTASDTSNRCAAARRLTPQDFAPVPEGRLCLQVVDGPETAKVTGRLSGVAVQGDFRRIDSCESARWDRVVAPFIAGGPGVS